MRKIILGLSLVILVFTGLGLSSTKEGHSVQAQEIIFESAEQALKAVLDDYLVLAGETAVWQLGDIQQSGRYAYTIAKAGDRVEDYQGYVMLLAHQEEAGNWVAIAPKVVENSVFNQLLDQFPDDLIGQFAKSYYYLYDEWTPNPFAPRTTPLHHFPWPIQREAVLTQKDGDYHMSQLDFVMRGTDDIYASKPGLVIFVKESSSVGGCDMDLWPWANMVVVQHATGEYSWYVHLKYGSATVKVGDLIGYGTKIGEQGNTGFACGTTGIHLHYMVSSEVPAGWPDPNVPYHAPWPPSGSIFPVDFIESSYAALVEYEYYLSQNAYPPGVCNLTPSQTAFYDNTYCNSILFSSISASFVDLIPLGAGAKVESIEIPDGWSAGLYQNQNELGPKTCLNQSDSMLWDNTFDNGEQVANNFLWARLYQAEDCPYPYEQGIALYPEENFGGIPLWGMVGQRSSSEPSYTVGSIYVPDGHSALIYDQDDLVGNAVCLTGSALNLAEVSGWVGGAVESVTLLEGDSCEIIPNPVPTPILLKPLNDGILYHQEPEFCWQMATGEYSFNVHVFNDIYDETSGWVSDTCWSSDRLLGQTGTYFWHVQARNADGEIGNWTATYEFSLEADIVPPTAKFLQLEEGDTVVQPRSFLRVLADDRETRVVKVHFFAWYDDGSETGYDWWYLGADEDGSDGWEIVWNMVPVVSADAAVWAYVEDLGGNFSSVFLSGLVVSNSTTNESGFEGRAIGGSESDEEILSESDSEDGIVADEEKSTRENSDTPEELSENPAVKPSAPAIILPVFDEAYYWPENVKLCWEGSNANQNLSYQVEVNGGQDLISPWISDTSWQPAGLQAGSGSYTWRVRTRDLDLGESSWSASGAFRLVLDEISPTAAILSPVNGSEISGQVLIQLSAADTGTGLRQVYFLAWYDDGTTGAEWHELGVQTIQDDISEFLWSLEGIPAQRVQIWVYVEDLSGNLGSAVVPEAFIIEGETEKNPTLYQKALRETLVIIRGD